MATGTGGPTEYLYAAVCKPHDCGENSIVLLFSAAKRAVYGALYERGALTMIGNPPAAVANELPGMWRKEWRQE